MMTCAIWSSTCAPWELRNEGLRPASFLWRPMGSLQASEPDRRNMPPRGFTRWLVTAPFVLGLVCRPAPGFGTAQEIPLVSGNPTRGRDVYVEKGCIACHAVRDPGGRVGPDLAAALVGKGIVGIAAAMLNHYPKMSAALQERNEPFPVAQRQARWTTWLPISSSSISCTNPAPFEKGRTLFGQKGCGRCHGLFPGGSSIGPPLGRAMLAAPPIQVAQAMWNHGTQMTAKMRELQVPWSTFEGQEMADLLAFLGGAVEPLPGRGAPLPGDPVAGRDLFQSKGCVRCHLKGESGETIGPDLVTGPWYKTATAIAGAMWNHGPAMWTQMKAIGITPPRFEDDEMGHVIAYLYLLRSAERPSTPERGRKLWSEKHCAQCHEAGGPGPDLATVEQLDTPIHFAAEMWNHAPSMQAFVDRCGAPVAGLWRIRGAGPGLVSPIRGSTLDPLRGTNRLTLRLALAIAALVAGVLALGLYVLSAHHFSGMVETRRHAAELQNRILEAALRHQMLEKHAKSSLIATILHEVGSQPEVQNVMILDHEGIIRQSSRQELVGQQVPRDSEACMVCHRKAPAERNRWAVLDLPGGEVLRSVQPIENRPECHSCHAPEKRLNGILIMDVSLAGLQAQLSRDRRWMVVATTALGLLLLASVGLIVRRLVLVRLANLGHAARSITAGDLTKRAAVGGDDAITELAMDFNNMADAVLGLVTDVKERESQLENVMNSVDDGLVVLDRDFRIVAANQAFCRRFGSHPEALHGRRCQEALDVAFQCEMCGAACPSARCLETGEVQRATFQLPSSNGEPGRVEEVHTSPVFDQDGNSVSGRGNLA